MVEQDALFPGYGFARHKGYGTAEHQAALLKLGVCPLHRLSFAPIAVIHHSSVAGEQQRLARGGSGAGFAA
jgi:ribonuclease HII